MLINTETFEQVTEYNFRITHPNTSFPSKLTDAILAPFGYAVLNFTSHPNFDSWTQKLTEGTPEQRDGKWYQTWILKPITHTPEEEKERLNQFKKQKLEQIDQETSNAILSGFDYTINDIKYHFSYDSFDQQNFADTANMCQLVLSGTEGLPASVTWNSYLENGTLVQQVLNAQEFLKLYTSGAMVHKATQMAIGGQRKAAVQSATTKEELDSI